MMKELKKIGLFVTLFSIALFIADRSFAYVMSKIFSKTKTGQSGGKINYYLNDYKKNDLLIMGDSRALNQVIPDSFKVETFNLCHAGMDDVFQVSLLDLLVSNNRKPQTILLHIDPVYYSGEDDNTSKSLFLRPFYGRSEVLNENIHHAGSWEKIKFLSSSYKYNNIILNIINNSRKDIPEHYCGFEPLPVTADDSLRTAITSQTDTVREEYSFNNQKLKHLQQIIEICRSNNIRLICFTAPVWKEKKIRTKTIQGKLQSFLSVNDVPYMDFTQGNSVCSSIQRSGFWNDCEHLNEKGAALFSQLIAQEFERITSAPTPRLKP